jgi:hypothetical protein
MKKRWKNDTWLSIFCCVVNTGWDKKGEQCGPLKKSQELIQMQKKLRQARGAPQNHTHRRNDTMHARASRVGRAPRRSCGRGCSRAGPAGGPG